MSVVKYNKYSVGYSAIVHGDIASFLKRTLTTADQTLVTSLIAEVEREICRQTRRQFHQVDTFYEEYPTGVSKFLLSNVPIKAITKIIIDGVEKTSNYTENVHYWIIDGQYVRFQTPLVASQNPYTGVRIEYSIDQFWGDDVKNLIKKMVSYEFLNSENAGVGLSNESFSDQSAGFNVSRFHKEKDELFKYYRMPNV